MGAPVGQWPSKVGIMMYDNENAFNEKIGLIQPVTMRVLGIMQQILPMGNFNFESAWCSFDYS